MSPEGMTYIGSTVNLERRLRQHNREIVGGARATGRSSDWKRVCHVVGFPDNHLALQFEWAWKYISRRSAGNTPLERRIKALIQLLNKEQATSNSIPFKDLEDPLCVYCEDTTIYTMLQNEELKYGIILEA